MTNRHTTAGAASSAGKSRNEGSAPAEEHYHRWRIAEQHGSLSSGQCKCGAEKDFLNSWDPEPGWTLHRGRGVSASRS